MKKLLKKIIVWLEDWRENERLWKAEHPYPEWSHRRLEVIEAVFGFVFRKISLAFWWLLAKLKSRCD